MKELLKMLWHGKLYPEENIGRDADYHYLHERVCEAGVALKASLSEEQRKQFVAYEQLDMELSALEDEIVFAKGFRLGVRLLLEALREA